MYAGFVLLAKVTPLCFRTQMRLRRRGLERARAISSAMLGRANRPASRVDVGEDAVNEGGIGLEIGQHFFLDDASKHDVAVRAPGQGTEQEESHPPNHVVGARGIPLHV
jgi:hypothetical protein